jgi:hypothetical protein
VILKYEDTVNIMIKTVSFPLGGNKALLKGRKPISKRMRHSSRARIGETKLQSVTEQPWLQWH